MYEIKKCTNEEINTIIETRLPLGLFFCESKIMWSSLYRKIWVGVDNRTGDAWTEDFKYLSQCKRWLNDIQTERDEKMRLTW